MNAWLFTMLQGFFIAVCFRFKGLNVFVVVYNYAATNDRLDEKRPQKANFLTLLAFVIRPI